MSLTKVTYSMIEGAPVNFKDFGVVGDGVTDDAAALQAAVNYASSLNRPVTILGDPSSIYYFSTDILIRSSFITVDLQWARVVANARFSFIGNLTDSDGALENDALLLESVHFCNAYFGNPNSFDTVTRGPFMAYVRNSSISNCVKNSRGGTSFNLHFAKDSSVYNVTNYGARTIGLGGTIGILLLHTINCEVRDCTVGGPGEWVYGTQQKGGYNNRWINVVCHDFDYANPTGDVIRERGDGPYTVSTTTGPYPYATGSWTAPDLRRAGHNTEYINCAAINTPLNMPGFNTEEAVGTRFVSCRSVNARGVNLYRGANAPAGYDDYYEVVNFRGDNVSFPLTATSVASTPMQYSLARGITVSSVAPITFATQREITLTNTSNFILRDVNIASSPAVSQNAISLTNSSNAVISNAIVRGQYTGSNAISLSSDSARTKFIDCNFLDAIASISSRVSSAPNTQFSNTVVAAFSTTDATTNTFTRADISLDTNAYLTVFITGTATNSQAFFQRKVGQLFNNTAGTVTAVGSATVFETVTVGAAAAGWSYSITVVSNIIRINVQGSVGSNVDWTVTYSWG